MEVLNWEEMNYTAPKNKKLGIVTYLLGWDRGMFFQFHVNRKTRLNRFVTR